ncbi:MAG: hypothetical protein UU42_C0026G0006 [Candidatus Woesebacteria bacterium GW2011_GWA1_41_13b]|uniref:Uncharacterized protein n=2 Tax=Candidatus Woeseibacteriota TaxID=1752722 RepID=A0A0G0XSV5_9BACT|nr:MAG: hypothetical protein UU42_C0026G0006 [Candidatus Woesebacteria bacterium GW2011_GWA1_41_13b]
MGDPVRHNNLARIVADVKYEELDSPTKITIYADKVNLQKLTQEQIEEHIKNQLEKVNIKPGTEIYSLHTSFSYPETNTLKDFDFGNILIEANLPYCLHIPDHYEIKVILPEKNIEALVTFRKFWTLRAKTDEGMSDNFDLVADNTPLFFKKSTVLGPVLPFKSEEGWDSLSKGINAEKMNDQNGTFRYTMVYIQLKLSLNESETKQIGGNADSLLNKIQETCLTIINSIIDNYRVVTNEAYVRRLGNLKTNLIYFLPQNQGFYLISLNTATAKMNIPLNDVKKLASLLNSGNRPDTYKLLQLDARDSLRSGDYTLAIVESFQALEIYLENYLTSGFKAKNTTESDYKKILDTNWKTKDRLNMVLNMIKGVSLNNQTQIWNSWCTRYDRTRKEVIHLGREATLSETQETIEINEKVINWLSGL